MKKTYGISTQIEYVNIKEILKNYKKPKYWKKHWCVFKTNNFKFVFYLSRIDIEGNAIEGRVNYISTAIVRGNRKLCLESLPWNYETITIPIANPDYKQETFERRLIGCIRSLIERLERLIIERTSDYRTAERNTNYYYDRVEELANQKLDEENITNEDIRDAYVEKCRDNASCDYCSQVLAAKSKTVLPNLYLMLFSWFDRPDDYKKMKSEILEKQSKLKSKLIGIKREQWIVNDKIESEEINDEIINDVLEEI